MTVCLCADIKEQQIRQAYKDGIKTFLQLREHLNVSNNCGTCTSNVMQIITDEMKKERGEY